MLLRPAFLLLCLAPVPVTQASITSGFGAVADVGFFDDCRTLCLRPGGLTDQTVNGGEFSTGTAITLTYNPAQRGFAAASFTGDVFSPVLRSSSRTPVDAGNAIDAIATAVQGYTYLGAAPADYSVQVSLSGTVAQPASNSEGVIRGRAAVYRYENARFSTDFSSFILEEVASEGEVLATAQLFLLPTLDLSQGTLDFTLNPGDEVYVWMQLSTKSERGAVVDATNTFDLTFTAGDVSMLGAQVVDGVDPVNLFADGFEEAD
ncbi:MAG: hypothetical protein AAGA23_00690 [Pseudomonadota bacterium]